MPDQSYIQFVLEKSFSKGVIDGLSEEQQRQVSGLITYILSKEAVINLEDTIDNAQTISKLISQLGKDTYMVGNFLCAGGGIIIGGSSFANYCKTQNRIAKTCYVISGFCGGTAAIFGTYSGFTHYCGLSIFAVGGDLLGGSFLWAGKKVQKIGNYVEGKTSVNLNPFRPRNFVRRPVSKRGMGLGYKGVSFVTSAPFDIPFETILIIGGTIFTIYSYGKILIAIYRYITQKLKILYSSARFIL